MNKILHLLPLNILTVVSTGIGIIASLLAVSGILMMLFSLIHLFSWLAQIDSTPLESSITWGLYYQNKLFGLWFLLSPLMSIFGLYLLEGYWNSVLEEEFDSKFWLIAIIGNVLLPVVLHPFFLQEFSYATLTIQLIIFLSWQTFAVLTSTYYCFYSSK